MIDDDFVAYHFVDIPQTGSTHVHGMSSDFKGFAAVLGTTHGRYVLDPLGHRSAK